MTVALTSTQCVRWYNVLQGWEAGRCNVCFWCHQDDRLRRCLEVVGHKCSHSWLISSPSTHLASIGQMRSSKRPWNKDRPAPRTRVQKRGSQIWLAGIFSCRRHLFWSQALFRVAGIFAGRGWVEWWWEGVGGGPWRFRTRNVFCGNGAMDAKADHGTTIEK